MTEDNASDGQIITFIRQRDYKLVRELGQGACGKTVLLHDDQIDEFLVCKKYVPYSESSRQELFANFVREIKLLHRVLHPNVVRVFNHFLYPHLYAGFLLMEFVDGCSLDEFLAQNPEQVNELFTQAISGFSYLERASILHRDIRPGNVMVREDGILKIIDLGFGKQIAESKDFDKSITLNWWCETPEEFQDSRYDFSTEVYFVGKLFEQIIQENGISNFKYRDTLLNMCRHSPESRVSTFADVEKAIGSDMFTEIDFSEEELRIYRGFSDKLCQYISKLESGTKYQTSLEKIRVQLNDAYRRFMLEEFVPDAAVVLRCFVAGRYHYTPRGFEVESVREFLQFIKSLPDERFKIVLANLHTKLDAVARYTEGDDLEEVPF